MKKTPTFGELITALSKRPFTDSQVLATCTKCQTKQTLEEARKRQRQDRVEYMCKKGCMVLTSVVVQRDGGFAMDNKVSVEVKVPPIGNDPSLS